MSMSMIPVVPVPARGEACVPEMTPTSMSGSLRSAMRRLTDRRARVVVRTDIGDTGERYWEIRRPPFDARLRALARIEPADGRDLLAAGAFMACEPPEGVPFGASGARYYRLSEAWREMLRPQPAALPQVEEPQLTRRRQPNACGPRALLVAASHGQGALTLAEARIALRYQQAAERVARGRSITTNWDRMVRVDASRSSAGPDATLSDAHALLDRAAERLDAQKQRILWQVCVSEASLAASARQEGLSRAALVRQLKSALGALAAE